jgi:nickel transport protein
VTVTLKVGDGHMASITLDANRFGGAAPPSPAAAVTTPAPLNLPDLPGERLAAQIEARVEAAVARQIRPLLEAQAQAEARIRVKDIAGGLGMILGLVGIALWALSRRRDPT